MRCLITNAPLDAVSCYAQVGPLNAFGSRVRQSDIECPAKVFDDLLQHWLDQAPNRIIVRVDPFI